MLVKLLGAIDVLAAITFLMYIFNITPFIQLVLFCAGLLFLKGLFILTGEPLSIIDLLASATLLIAMFVTPWSFILWILALLLMAKGIVSFI